MSIAEPITHTLPSTSEQAWARVTRSAPRLTETAGRYLAQIAVSSRPATVGKAEQSLRAFALHLVDEHADVTSFAQVGRVEVEAFKLALHHHRTATGRSYSVNTLRTTLGMVRMFFDRIIEWDWPDAPSRTPLHATDLPAAVDPLPKFLDDADAARLMRAAQQAKPFDRLVVTLLARTGIRVGELCALEADALVRSDGGWWLRIPLGKLRNDRYVPVHPELLDLLLDWRTTHGQHADGWLLHRDGRRVDRHTVTRTINRVARVAGLGHVHPHQLRHTLATQAINRGMRLEAIAALLGHRSLRMTMVYARIANRTVADEYHAAAKVDAVHRHDRTQLQKLAQNANRDIERLTIQLAPLVAEHRQLTLEQREVKQWDQQHAPQLDRLDTIDRTIRLHHALAPTLEPTRPAQRRSPQRSLGLGL
jgi:integrase